MSKVRRWELAGVVFTVLSGSVLHFAFAWTGYWTPAALLLPVNESVWEHLKLAFWPGLGFALVEFAALRKDIKNFWIAKSVALSSAPALITVFFYAYTTVVGDHILAADIAIFVVAVVVAQAMGYNIMRRRPVPPEMRAVAGVWLGVLILAFSLLTFRAPHLPPFRDPATGQYGILNAYPAHD